MSPSAICINVLAGGRVLVAAAPANGKKDTLTYAEGRLTPDGEIGEFKGSGSSRK